MAEDSVVVECGRAGGRDSLRLATNLSKGAHCAPETHMSKHQGAEHHRQAADHHEKAAEHHRRAAEHHDNEDHVEAAHHAHVAHGHSLHATHHAEEAGKQHANNHA